MIYLDSAATTLQKPPPVAVAAKRAVSRLASPGRGGHSSAMLAAEKVFQCRVAAAQLFSVQNPENIVFTSNATHSLNIAIKSLAKKGDRVVVSGYEHNSVVRPLKAIGAKIVVAGSQLFEPELAVHAFETRLTSDTDLVVCNHVSNVFGYILPVERMAEICKEKGVPFIIDASQSAGTLDIDADKLGADFIALPGHKGLYGPQGTGILICGGGVNPGTILEGGTGSDSLSEDMPAFLPDRLEAGTHNLPGISGLLEGIKFVEKKGTESILSHERELIGMALKGFRNIRGIEVFSSEHLFCQSGVLSFNLWNTDCEIVAGELAERKIALRSGLHCSPLAHKTAGTVDRGTVRMSVSAFNTRREIDTFLNTLEDIAVKFKARK